jgi:hypothetical protein
MADEERKQPVSVYPKPDLLEWIDREAERDGRSRTKQIEYFLEEARRIREHNRKIPRKEIYGDK